MNINTPQIISKARHLYQVDQSHTLRHYVARELLKISFDALFNQSFPDYDVYNSKPEILTFDDVNFIGDIEINNMDYADFDEKEYELFGIMRDAEDWTNANILKLMDDCAVSL